jgi:methionyl-tRNA formyltransferase
VHGSLLPRWRGAAPIQRAILAGDAVSGVTIMQMDEGLDTGPMLLRREMPIDGKTSGQVIENMSRLGAEALIDWLRNPTGPVPQPEHGVTYAAKIAKAEARIDWSRGAGEIVRHVLAFSPAPGAWFEMNGERVKLLAAEQAEGSGAPGEVLDDALTVACGNGAVRPVTVQRAGRGAMSVAELLRGFAVAKGTVLT